MKRLIYLLMLITPFTFLSTLSFGQCDINTGCAGSPILSIDPPVFDVPTSTINLNNVTFGEFECATVAQSGIVIYIYQLLPNGDRMESCGVLNAAPFNVVGSVSIGFGASNFCTGNTTNIGTIPIGLDNGFEACDGALLEVEAVLFITDNTSFDATEGSVYGNLDPNEFISIDVGTVELNISNEFPANGQPLTTAIINDFATDADGPLTVNCGEDVALYVEGLSRLANCIEYDEIITGIPSELSNELYYTINGGAPVFVQNAATGAAGGVLTGPDPAIGNECYAGILTPRNIDDIIDNPYILEWADLPQDLCDGSTVVVTITTTDVFTGVTLSDEITIIYMGGDACQDCGAIPGCTNMTACNYNPAATEDDGSCLPTPTCNTDPCAGDLEIVDPNDACVCIVDQVQVNGCTDVNACNYDSNANCNDGTCDLGNPACDDPCLELSGCTDVMACNYDANACVDDGSCNLGNPACADPCNEIFGCTNAAACNFNPDACVDDGSCNLGNPACADPCNEILGCTDDTACNFNPDACVDNGSCTAPPCNAGCTDPCADNYNPNADEDDGSCNPYNDTCNEDCTLGNFGGTWDPATCACINETVSVLGCADSTASNYDSTANCDDGSCIFEMCEDPCAPNFGAAEACEPYNTTCNNDCTVGPFGGTWDAATCACINETASVLGCTDIDAANYDPTANCDDGSCVAGPCEEEITGAIVTPDEGCDVGGITISVIAPDGTIINVVTEADGTFSVPGGPFPCGTYMAAFFDTAEIPACYAETGSTEPITFDLDGDEESDNDFEFIANPSIPTLSQWGLIILALLLMSFGAVQLFLSTNIFSFRNL